MIQSSRQFNLNLLSRRCATINSLYESAILSALVGSSGPREPDRISHLHWQWVRDCPLTRRSASPHVVRLSSRPSKCLPARAYAVPADLWPSASAVTMPGSSSCGNPPADASGELQHERLIPALARRGYAGIACDLPGHGPMRAFRAATRSGRSTTLHLRPSPRN
jgi:hypothetical protein